MKASRAVVGAIIVDSLTNPSRVLAARRTGAAPFAGNWEFPGGKVEAGEDPISALRRELAEELSIAVRVGAELPPPERSVWPISDVFYLRLWFVEIAIGQPTPGNSHDEVRWLARQQINDVTWLNSDLAAVPAVAEALASAGWG